MLIHLSGHYRFHLLRNQPLEYKSTKHLYHHSNPQDFRHKQAQKHIHLYLQNNHCLIIYMVHIQRFNLQCMYCLEHRQLYYQLRIMKIIYRKKQYLYHQPPKLNQVHISILLRIHLYLRNNQHPLELSLHLLQCKLYQKRL